MSKKKEQPAGEATQVGRQPFTPDCPKCNGEEGNNPGQKLRATSTNGMFTYYACPSCSYSVKLTRPTRAPLADESPTN